MKNISLKTKINSPLSSFATYSILSMTAIEIRPFFHILILMHFSAILNLLILKIEQKERHRFSTILALVLAKWELSFTM